MSLHPEAPDPEAAHGASRVRPFPAEGSSASRRSTRRSRLVHRALAALAGADVVEREILGLAQLVQPGDVCLDIGAEYGLYSQALVALVGPEGRVHSVEPQVGPMRVLAAGVRLTGCQTVQRHRVALGRVSGPAALSVPVRHGLPVHGRAFLTAGAVDEGANREFAGAREAAVEVLTLDALCEREEIARIDFVKADVEGAELAVLHGGRRTLAVHRPTLLLEIEERHCRRYGHDAAHVVAWLTGHGYRMHRWRDGCWDPVDAVAGTARNHLFVARA